MNPNSNPWWPEQVPAPRGRLLRFADAHQVVVREIGPKVLALATYGWRWVLTHSKLRVHAKSRRMRVSETVSLGDKRFVSIVEVDGQSFLIGGGSSGVALLTSLERRGVLTPFPEVPKHAWQERETA